MSSSTPLLGPLSDLVARCVLAFERDGEPAVERELATAPELAGPARTQLASLRQAGLLLAPVAPEQFGPYRVVRRLGTGGMGTVWLCEQQAPVRREVAVKVMRPGLDHAELLVRFQLERQALALLTHPGIARVLDAGVTGDRRPYFVMDYVPGIAVTQFCDAHALDLRRRLELFAQICDAVQHAHQKGIVHRDLKPGNVLVVERDGEPVPIVIDFGVAKSVTNALHGATLLTMPGRLIGTPEYMSPEQAASELDLDTRTDIYSLGAVLYELLTGELPIESARLRNLADLPRVIAEVVPPRASVRCAGLAGDRRAEHARARATTPMALARALRGDLDWIAAQALEKDRNRRYESAAELARDVRRHLAQEPIAARPPSRWYALRRFCARHRLPVAAAATVLLAMAGATATSLVFWRDAAAAERTALTSNSRLEHNLDSTLDALDRMVALGAEGLRTPESEPMRRALLRTALDHHERLIAGGHDPDHRLTAALATALARAAQLHVLLGEQEDAGPLLARAEAALAGLAAPLPLTAATRLQIGRAHLVCGELQKGLGQLEGAHAHGEAALGAFRAAEAGGAEPRSARTGQIGALRMLADLHTADDVAQARALLQQALPLAELQLADPGAIHQDQVQSLRVMGRLAWLRVETEDAASAAALLLRASDRTFELLGRESELSRRLDFVPVLDQIVTVAVRLRLYDPARRGSDLQLAMLRTAVQREPGVPRHKLALSDAVFFHTMLAGDDVEPAAQVAENAEALRLEEEGLTALGNTPELAVRYLNKLLDHAARMVDWLALDEHRRRAVDVARIDEALGKAEAVWRGLPEAYRRDRHPRESWLMSFLVRAALHRHRGQTAAMHAALAEGVGFASALLAEQPDVVQIKMIRAEMRIRHGEDLRRAGDAAGAWRAAREALDDLTAAAPTFTQPSRWSRIEDMRRPATELLIALAAEPQPADDLAATAAQLTAIAIAADRVAAGPAAGHSAEAAITLLRQALGNGLPPARLDDAAFDRLRAEPAFTALRRG